MPGQQLTVKTYSQGTANSPRRTDFEVPTIDHLPDPEAGCCHE
jgi:hypothetical protein